LSISFPFGNVEVTPGLRLRASQPLHFVDSANNVSGTNTIGISVGTRRTARHLSTYMERLLKKREKEKQ
jgi:hypothetical protein